MTAVRKSKSKTNKARQTKQDKQSKTNKARQTKQDKQSKTNKARQTKQDKQSKTNKARQTKQDKDCHPEGRRYRKKRHTAKAITAYGIRQKAKGKRQRRRPEASGKKSDPTALRPGRGFQSWCPGPPGICRAGTGDLWFGFGVFGVGFPGLLAAGCSAGLGRVLRSCPLGISGFRGCVAGRRRFSPAGCRLRRVGHRGRRCDFFVRRFCGKRLRLLG